MGDGDRTGEVGGGLVVAAEECGEFAERVATGRRATVKPEVGGGPSRWGSSDAYSSSAPFVSPSAAIAIVRKVARTLSAVRAPQSAGLGDAGDLVRSRRLTW
ncbi:hypothetical protein [Streptomyces sp.]|uniref:hypothetical protein n=1 Tax=Streptomyces sp. TaxID=1931 RepID=UPI002D76A51B|nr:hypothetical protein [Streptomyces sp.]HET6357494.1 hypothetical protein [Streptomyces sp.]